MAWSSPVSDDPMGKSRSFDTVIWGGFSVSNATVNRFFALHYLLPFVLAALAAVHMITLHSHGSGNPLGISANSDRVAMMPYFIFKDLVTVVAGMAVMALLVFYMPNALGHSDNYVRSQPHGHATIHRTRVVPHVRIPTR